MTFSVPVLRFCNGHVSSVVKTSYVLEGLSLAYRKNKKWAPLDLSRQA